MAPDGLAYIESWVEDQLRFAAFQFDGVRRCRLAGSVGQATGGIWFEFEFVAVRPSKEAVEIITLEL